MKTLHLSSFVALGLLTISNITSCKKDTTLKLNDIEIVQQNLQQDEGVSDTFVEIISLGAIDMNLLEGPQQGLISTNITSSTTSAGCKSVTINPIGNTFPKTITIDFGSGCEEGGKIRKGKIIAVFTGRLKDPGSVVSITFDNFYINNDKIEGTKTITNNGLNTKGRLSFSVQVNHTRTLSTGGTVSHTMTKTFNWLEGAGTVNPWDDVFSITGTESGTNSKGNTFSSLIIEPLIKKVSCHFIVAGKIEIKINDLPAHTIDFGDGSCDNKAILSINGVSKEILLRK